MTILVVEDDFVNRTVLQKMLAPFGEVHIAVNGGEALEAVKSAVVRGTPYDLICLDIMMPGINGQAVLRGIRTFEEEKGVKDRTKIVMTTALSDKESVMHAIKGQCDGYFLKPYDKAALLKRLRELGLPVGL